MQRELAGRVKQIVGDPFRGGRTLVVSFPQEELLVNRWLAEACVRNRFDHIAIKRSFPRYQTNADFIIEPGENAEALPLFVKGYNVSDRGLGVLCKARILAGTRVQVRSDFDAPDAPPVPASIMHCTQTVGGFKIGLRFDLERYQR